MRDEQFIEIREYASPAADGDEITGPLRWYVNGWYPTFDVGNGAGVRTLDDAAVPFTYNRWCWRGLGAKL